MKNKNGISIILGVIGICWFILHIIESIIESIKKGIIKYLQSPMGIITIILLIISIIVCIADVIIKKRSNQKK